MEFHHEHDEEEEEEEEEVGEMALPINTTYGHNHILPLSLHQPPPDMSTITAPPPPPPSMEDISKKMMVVVRYRECLKNHAASIGGKATDGCGEFMASGEEGTLEALTCAVCSCHRNFHRKEMEGDNPSYHRHHHPIPTTSYDYINYHSSSPHLKRLDLGNGRNLILQAHHHHPNGVLGNGGGALVPYNMGMGMGMGMGGFRSESEEQEDRRGAAVAQQVVKKRFRTKFTQEQKEKMMNFAEKVGWKIQRQEESVVQHFCQEIGIKRRVLKVWMHNNKQNLAKNITNSISINAPQPQDPN
ncbi:zinc-finger homeodomain protein 3 [Lactuca sativa]|uniref:zinc-finger homeodomain protein 3 n=1 Tax=Lactuca sativa TaxID=4236 RepID=UPI000CBC0CF5|nr:zinc-finger homeodomain protein 3 [Lactuca sativa]